MINLLDDIISSHKNQVSPLFFEDTQSFNEFEFWKLRTQMVDLVSHSSEKKEVLDSFEEYLKITPNSPFEIAVHLSLLSALSDIVDCDIDSLLKKRVLNMSLQHNQLLSFSQKTSQNLITLLSLFLVMENILQLDSTEKLVFPFSSHPTETYGVYEFTQWIFTGYPELLKDVNLYIDLINLDLFERNFDVHVLFLMEFIQNHKLSHASPGIPDINYI